MQYDLTLAGYGIQRFEVLGKFFKFVGTGKIRVTTSKGGSIDLLPGQGVWGEEYSSLSVQDRTGTGSAGVLLAGFYDFRDDTLTGQVSVINGDTARVPVAVDTGYSSSWVNSTNYPTQYSVVEIVAPVANVRGITVRRPYMKKSTIANGRQSFIAKATPPITDADGDVLYWAWEDPSNAMAVYESSDVVTIPPGKGLYFVVCAANAGVLTRSILYKVL